MGAIIQVLLNWLAANLQLIFSWFGVNAQAILSWLVTNWIFTMSCALTTIICLIYQTIQNPEGALNQFMIMVISSVIVLFPSTPDDLKIASLLGQFNTAFPQVGSYVLAEIFSGIVGLSTVFLFTKLWKLLPFI